MKKSKKVEIKDSQQNKQKDLKITGKGEQVDFQHAQGAVNTISNAYQELEENKRPNTNILKNRKLKTINSNRINVQDKKTTKKPIPTTKDLPPKSNTSPTINISSQAVSQQMNCQIKQTEKKIPIAQISSPKSDQKEKFKPTVITQHYPYTEKHVSAKVQMLEQEMLRRANGEEKESEEEEHKQMTYFYELSNLSNSITSTVMKYPTDGFGNLSNVVPYKNCPPVWNNAERNGKGQRLKQIREKRVQVRTSAGNQIVQGDSYLPNYAFPPSQINIGNPLTNIYQQKIQMDKRQSFGMVPAYQSQDSSKQLGGLMIKGLGANQLKTEGLPELYQNETERLRHSKDDSYIFNEKKDSISGQTRESQEKQQEYASLVGDNESQSAFGYYAQNPIQNSHRKKRSNAQFAQTQAQPFHKCPSPPPFENKSLQLGFSVGLTSPELPATIRGATEAESSRELYSQKKEQYIDKEIRNPQNNSFCNKDTRQEGNSFTPSGKGMIGKGIIHHHHSSKQTTKDSQSNYPAKLKPLEQSDFFKETLQISKISNRQMQIERYSSNSPRANEEEVQPSESGGSTRSIRSKYHQRKSSLFDKDISPKSTNTSQHKIMLEGETDVSTAILEQDHDVSSKKNKKTSSNNVVQIEGSDNSLLSDINEFEDEDAYEGYSDEDIEKDVIMRKSISIKLEVPTPIIQDTSRISDDIELEREKPKQPKKQIEEQKTSPQKNKKKIEIKKEDSKNKMVLTIMPGDNPDVKRKKRAQGLMASIPKNLEEQERAFFESGCTINPQFEYENAYLSTKFLSSFKKPKGDLIELAKKIIENFLKDYGSESNFIQSQGRVLTIEETEEYFTKYINDLGIGEQLTLHFSENQIAPTSVTHDVKTGKCKINIALPIEYTSERIKGVLHHELGTHYIRRINEKQQVWHTNRKKYEMKNCIVTEEGLACINALYDTALEKRLKPYLYKYALHYYSCCLAGSMSFVELFNSLEQYVDNPKRRWKSVLRVKRGMENTQEAGGLYKDQVYLEGAVKILKNRLNIDFRLLYGGKINIEDLERPFIQKKLKAEKIKIPCILKDMTKYIKALDIIAKTNFVDEFAKNQTTHDS